MLQRPRSTSQHVCCGRDAKRSRGGRRIRPYAGNEQGSGTAKCCTTIHCNCNGKCQFLYLVVGIEALNYKPFILALFLKQEISILFWLLRADPQLPRAGSTGAADIKKDGRSRRKGFRVRRGKEWGWGG